MPWRGEGNVRFQTQLTIMLELLTKEKVQPLTEMRFWNNTITK